MPNIYTIYHNPRCSKSRQTLALLEAKVDMAQVKSDDNNRDKIEIIKYLDTPPTAKTLKHILSLLALDPIDIIRKTETEYKTLNISSANLSNSALIKLMVENPKLIERPIVVKTTAIKYNKEPETETAVIGRPPENVNSL